MHHDAINEQQIALREGPCKLVAKLDGEKLPKLSNFTDLNVQSLRRAALTDFTLYKISGDIGEARDVSSEEPARLKALSAQLELLYRELVQTMHVWPEVAHAPTSGKSTKKK